MLRAWKYLENISDGFLFIFITIPGALLLLTEPFCDGWNEGTMEGSCSIGMFDGLYNGMMSVMLVSAFTIFPIIVIGAGCALILSIAAKIIRWGQGGAPRQLPGYLTEMARLFPVILVCVTIYWLVLG